MAGPELTLKWEKFGLSQGLNSMLESGELVDVTIVCQGEFLQAHKTVLAACSQQFRQMFSMNPCKHPVIFMQDVQLMHMKSLMTFMYTGQTTVLQRELAGFMNTAEALKISGLTTSQDTPQTAESRSATRPRPSKRPRMSQPGPSRQQQQMIMDDVKVESEELCELSPDVDDENLIDDYDTELVSAELGDDMEPLPGTSIVNEADLQEAWIEEISGGPSYTSPAPGPSSANTAAPAISSRAVVELRGEMREVIVVPPIDRSEDDKPIKHLKCNFCDRQVKSKHSLRTHIRNYHSKAGTGHACEICGKKYTLKCGLQVHMKNIHGDKAVPVTCQDCGKTFPNKMAHYKHVGTKHHFRIANKKPKLDTLAGQTKAKRMLGLPELPDIKWEIPASNYLDIITSPRKEAEIRPYSCQTCGRKFKSKDSVRSHISNYHSAREAERSHECDICGKQYTLSGGLRVHMKNEHGENAVPVECEDCGKVFRNKMAHYKHVFSKHRHRITDKSKD